MSDPEFSDRVTGFAPTASKAEVRVLDYLLNNRETALHASGAQIANAAGTSDVTVIRTARKLGYDGLDALRKGLARDLRRDLSLSDRMANDVAQARTDSPLSVATTALRGSLNALDKTPDTQVARAVQAICAARRVHVFGIGPSGFIAGYLAAQLVRLGIDSRAINRTGLQLADDLVGINPGDMVIALAYDRPYAEIRALFDRVKEVRIFSVLVTSDSATPPDTRASETFRIPRGRAQGFGLHSGTLALLEGLIIAVSAADPNRVAAALKKLNAARTRIAGDEMGV